jgi:hypothetical protein
MVSALAGPLIFFYFVCRHCKAEHTGGDKAAG